MRLLELLGDVDVTEWSGDRRVDIRTLVHDSREAAPGSCFACVPGARTDGHQHAAAAVAAGSVALLVERPLPIDVTQARVADVRRVVGPAASRLLGHPSRALRCLGVTGTNGKTTTTHLLEAIALAAGEPAGLIGTIGARVAGEAIPEERTTPEATELQSLLARMVDEGVTTVAIEVSSHALDQHRVDGTWFAAACFTNLSHDHLDYHPTMSDYFEAKAALFRAERAGVAVVNAGDEHGAEIARRSRAEGLPTVTFAVTPPDGAGPDGGADLRADAVTVSTDRTTFVLRGAVPGRQPVDAPIFTHLRGAVNVENALAAAATALAVGLPLDAVVEGIGALPAVPGRLEPVVAGQPFTVLVDYAHTPAALERALASAAQLADNGRVIAVFGCGGDRDREKRPLMGRAAGRVAQQVVLTSDNPRSEAPHAIADAVAVGLDEVGAAWELELDRRTAIRRALRRAREGDVVVIAGKGHETGQQTGADTVAFDDRVVAREELEALGCT